ncbi:MAG: hypothetical protein HYX32_09535 [Actinobacteria bacterium]|nr:hypothetical protein [Actinomycetota bacterium]
MSDRRHRGPVTRRAFVTLLMINDSYLPGCLTAAYALRAQRTSARLVCLVTPDITERAIDALLSLYDDVIVVEEVNPPRDETGKRQALPRMLTRFNALRLGPDGDLDRDYERVILLDADLLPLRDFDSLWELATPAGVINERREHMVELDEAGQIVWLDDDSATSSRWHEIYGAICPHGSMIPKEITDRVGSDPTNFGVNGSLFLLEPSAAEFGELMSWIRRPEMDELVRRLWPWPDMQAATLFWSGRWTSIDVSYSVLYGYPSLAFARGLHFAGVKPWSWRKKGFARRIERFADYRLWATTYLEMLASLPELRDLRRLKLLEDEIRAALDAI